MTHAEAISILGLTAHEAAAMIRSQRSRPEDENVGPWRVTKQEAKVLDLIADGSCTKQAAHALGVSPKTVDSYRMRIYERMGTSTMTRSAILWDRWRREERGRALVTEWRAA